MKTVPRLGLITLIALGMMIGTILAVRIVIVHEIGEEGVNYMRSQE
jgi:hypothetical protein